MTGIVWWEVESPDPEEFQAFTRALFGWEFEAAFGDAAIGADYWMIRARGDDGTVTSIGGLQRSPHATVPVVGTRVYGLVANLELTLSRVASLGGIVERRRTALGGDDRWFATVRDPSGVSLGLWTPNPPFD